MNRSACPHSESARAPPSKRHFSPKSSRSDTSVRTSITEQKGKFVSKKNLPKPSTPTTPKTTEKTGGADPLRLSPGDQRPQSSKPNAPAVQPARPAAAPALSPVSSAPSAKNRPEVAPLLPASAPPQSAKAQESSRPSPRSSPARAMQAEPAASPAPAKTTASHQTIGVTFCLVDPQAKQVSVCGDFNDWRPNVTPLTRKADGRWEATLPLRPGRYQYKFLADDRWLHDPRAQENVPNPHGSLNSVIEVRT